MELDQALIELNHLNERINLIDSNLKFNITIFLGLLTLFLGLAGWALSVLVKRWVDTRVDKEMNVLNERIKEFLSENPQILWAKGSGILKSIIQGEKGIVNHTYALIGLESFKKEHLIYLDVHYYLDGKKISVDSSNIKISDDEIEVIVHWKDGWNSNIQVQAFVLWNNPLYLKYT